MTVQGAEELASELFGTGLWLDPSQEPPTGPLVLPNPLQIFSLDQVEGAAIATHLACGKSHSAFKRKHRQYFCGLHFALKIEKLNRDALKS